MQASRFLLLVFLAIALANGDDDKEMMNTAPEEAQDGLRVEIMYPPPDFVFQHESDVQLVAVISTAEDIAEVLGPDFTWEMEVSWDRRSSFPASAETSITIGNLLDGPHRVRVWVKPSQETPRLRALRDQGAEVELEAVIKFFLRSDIAEETPESELPSLELWQKGFMKLLVQHPPPNYIFKANEPVFAEVRISDKEMELNLDDAVELMYSRETVYQRRPYSIAFELDGQTLGVFRRVKHIPFQMGEGKHEVRLSLLDIHDIVIAEERLQVEKRETALIADSSHGDESCTGHCLLRRQCQATDVCGPSDEIPCSGHGECVGGFCFCNGDWVGPTCSHNMLQDVRFLPNEDPSAGVNECRDSRWYNDLAHSLATEIWRIQNPAECDGLFRLRVPLQGIGIMIQFLVGGITEALESGRTMTVESSDWPWLNHPDCAGSGLQCYFAPVTNCTNAMEDVDEIHAKELTRGHIQRAGLGIDAKGRPNGNVGILVPSAYSHKGSFWYRSHVLHSILQLWPFKQYELRNLRNRLGFSSNGKIIGVHVRRGDACAASVGYRTPCQGMEVYMMEVRTLAQKYGVKDVFIASDDSTALHYAAQTSNLNVRYVPADRSILESNWYVEDRIRNGLLNAGIAGESAIVDIFLLSSCDYFVGTFSSHFGALAFEMMAARKGLVPPYISLDLAWAPRH